MEWDGEYKSARDAQASLVPGIVPAALIMALILVGLFNSYRKPLIIVLIIPFAMIGVTLGLLITRQPFGFVALLAAMSLAGMMVKNAIVLVDEIDALQAAGQAPFDAVINAAVSRLRPVLLAAGTTVPGRNPAAERRVLGFDVGRDHVWAHAGSHHYDGTSADDLLPSLWNQKSRRQRGKRWWDFNSASRLTNSFGG